MAFHIKTHEVFVALNVTLLQSMMHDNKKAIVSELIALSFFHCCLLQHRSFYERYQIYLEKGTLNITRLFYQIVQKLSLPKILVNELQ